MPENNLKIGATVDVGAISSGMADVAEITRAATQNVAISFEEVSSKTKSAMRNLSSDVKEAADSVSKESIKVAEATKLQAEAFADLRRATVLTRDEQFDAALAAKLLAAAQEKVAAAAAEKATAVKAASAAAVEAAEEENLSANLIVRGFQRASIQVRESLGEIQEKLVETAETSKITGEGMTAGFGAISGLLGAGIAVGFFGHFLDESAKVNVELGHLHIQTDIAVDKLAGLREVVKEMGGEWDPVATGVYKLAVATDKARDEASKQADILHRLGITQEEIKASNPEEMLVRVGRAFYEHRDAALDADAAQTLFGKGGKALIPVLKEHGENLGDLITKQGKLSGVTDESVAAAERWTRNMAIASREFQSFGNFAIENMHYLVGAWEAVTTSIMTAFEVAAAAIVSTAKAVGNLGKLLYDASTFNFGAIVDDAKNIGTSFVGVWKDAFGEIHRNWQAVSSDFAKTVLPPAEKHKPQDEEEDGGGGGKKPKHGRDLSFQRDEQELNELRLATARSGNEFLLAAEVRFWEAKLAAAQKGSDEYRQVLAKLAPLEERLAKQKGPEGVQLIAPDLSAQVAAFEAANRAEIKGNEEAQREMLSAFRSAREEEIRLQDEKFRDLEQDTAFEVSQARMTADERLAILKDAANKEFEIRKSAVAAMQAVDMNDAAKYQQDLNRELELIRRHDRQIVQLNQQTANQSQKGWQQAYERMTSEFNRNVAQWVTTQRGFAQSMAQMMNGITQNFIQNLLKMTAQEILAAIQHKALMKQSVIHDAYGAAADAYKWGSSWGGPVAGAVSAAAAFAGVMAFESFNEGGVVQQGNGAHVPILAKQGERVLTPTQNQNFESLVNNRTSSQSSTVNARVTQNFPSSAKPSSAKETQRAVQSLVRRGKLAIGG